MIRTLTGGFTAADKKAFLVLLLAVLLIVALTMTQDYLRSDLRNSAFYFSESFLFSSFWWIFAPLLFAQYFAVRYTSAKRLSFQAAVILIPMAVHLFAFPFLVFFLSGIFLDHTFAFQRTLNYTLSEHVYLLALLYSLPVLTYRYFRKKITAEKELPATENEFTARQFTESILVSDGNKKIPVAVTDIIYFSANPPYISIHLAGRKYLQKETLKSISLQLNPEQFVRIHKSTIINIKQVTSYSTRLNGDYDLTMNNDVTLRVSRNFAAGFKQLLNKATQLTAK